MFVSLAHGDEEIDRTVEAVADFFATDLWAGDRGEAARREPALGATRSGREASASASRSSRRSPTSGSRSASRRSTRATSSTTAGRGSSRRPTRTRRSCSATTSTRTGSSGSPAPATSTPSRDLAELISLCAQLRAEGEPGDGAAWAATARALGTASSEPRRPRAASERARRARPPRRLDSPP